jgi:hypothetical protein
VVVDNVLMEAISLTEITLSISNEYAHGHALRVLDNNPGLADEVRRIVTGPVGIVRTTRRTKDAERSGLTADSLNLGLKESFRRSGGWSFEAAVREGVIFDWSGPDSKTEGFDLARYDSRANLARAWSWCFGRRAVVGGAKEWKSFVLRRPELADLAEKIADSGTPGFDLSTSVTESTIFGEVQFGNWGLAYRDLLRLVDADGQTQVDLYIYVTGDGGLNQYLSKGIVTFTSIVQILAQFSRLVRVPVWVIGLSASKLDEI